MGAVFNAVKETLEEYAADQSSMEPSLFSRDDVQGVMEYLRRIPPSTGDAGTKNKVSTSVSAVSSNRGDNYATALSLAELLLSVGVPLQSSSATTASVESILLSLSRSEMNLLRECIWVRKEPSAKMWNSIVGLERVQQGLTSALATVKQQSSHSYSSLFDNSSAGVLLYGPYVCVQFF
jgi:hypothetical protein